MDPKEAVSKLNEVLDRTDLHNVKDALLALNQFRLSNIDTVK
jgi:hypothetical protein